MWQLTLVTHTQILWFYYSHCSLYFRTTSKQVIMKVSEITRRSKSRDSLKSRDCYLKIAPPSSDTGTVDTSSLSDGDDEEERFIGMEIGRPRTNNLMDDSDGTLKLIFCCVGIYSAYLIYGSLQEDLFTYTSSTITSSPAFTYIWLVQVIEAAINTITGYVGLYMTRSKDELRNPKPNQKLFLLSGVSQVCSKALTCLSLASGLSFPVATMTKSAKMAPVMMGQLFLGGTQYCWGEYLQVAAIIVGTALLGLGKSQGEEMAPSSMLGVAFILLSLVMDGLTGGLQKRAKRDATAAGRQPIKGFEFMMYTNMHMCWVAFGIANLNGHLVDGISYCLQDKLICSLIFKFCVCSAIGQGFIFYTIASFDPLVCSTITTTRKLVSVFLSIFWRGHVINAQGWFGLSIACAGILSEVHSKVGKTKIERKKEVEV